MPLPLLKQCHQSATNQSGSGFQSTEKCFKNKIFKNTPGNSCRDGPKLLRTIAARCIQGFTEGFCAEEVSVLFFLSEQNTATLKREHPTTLT